MSGAPKGQPHTPARTGLVGQSANAPQQLTSDEILAKDPAHIVRCFMCVWGQDKSMGFRRCRGRAPTAAMRQMTPSGSPHSVAMFPEVTDWDYCADGKPLDEPADVKAK